MRSWCPSWTTPDPKPRDFDGDLATLDPRHSECGEGDPAARLIVLVGIEGADAKRRELIFRASGKTAADVIAQLLRDAERSPE